MQLTPSPIDTRKSPLPSPSLFPPSCFSPFATVSPFPAVLSTRQIFSRFSINTRRAEGQRNRHPSPPVSLCKRPSRDIPPMEIDEFVSNFHRRRERTFLFFLFFFSFLFSFSLARQVRTRDSLANDLAVQKPQANFLRKFLYAARSKGQRGEGGISLICGEIARG